MIDRNNTTLIPTWYFSSEIYYFRRKFWQIRTFSREKGVFLIEVLIQKALYARLSKSSYPRSMSIWNFKIGNNRINSTGVWLHWKLEKNVPEIPFFQKTTCLTSYKHEMSQSKLWMSASILWLTETTQLWYLLDTFPARSITFQSADPYFSSPNLFFLEKFWSRRLCMRDFRYPYSYFDCLSETIKTFELPMTWDRIPTRSLYWHLTHLDAKIDVFLRLSFRSLNLLLNLCNHFNYHTS